MISDEILGYLSANGHPGGTLAALPETPSDAFTIWEYPGQPPMHVKGQRAPVMEIPRFQIITRSASYATARAKAERIYRLLAGFSGKLSGVTYERITALQPPAFLDRDSATPARARFVTNYEAKKELSPLA